MSCLCSFLSAARETRSPTRQMKRRAGLRQEAMAVVMVVKGVVCLELLCLGVVAEVEDEVEVEEQLWDRNAGSRYCSCRLLSPLLARLDLVPRKMLRRSRR